MNVLEELARSGIKPGVSIRFQYSNGGKITDRQGQIIAIRDVKEVKAKLGKVESVSRCLYIVSTEKGIRSFWESKMYEMEII